MKILEITENDANQRLDKFLKKLFPNATLSLIYKLNRKSKIKVSLPPHNPLLSKEGRTNDSESGVVFKKRDNEYKLQVWQKIKLFISDADFDEFRWPPLNPLLSKEGKRSRGGLEKKDIIFEDDDLLIVNKNPGINVHPGDHKSSESSLIHMAQDYLWSQHNSLTFKPSLAHRIDRDTSGILMIAKKKQMLTQLTNDFKSHVKIKKTYYAICHGKLSQPSGTINKKLLRVENAKNSDKVQVSEKWLTAITHYKLIKQHTLKTKQWTETISEVEVRIETGRMHQIRVHMAHLWFPILWDKNYWNKSFNSYITREFGLTRQALHAWKIEFYHYGEKQTQKLQAPIKDDLRKFINKIK